MTGKMTITERAAEKVRALLAQAKAGHGLRIRVVEGGCSGFEYKMAIDSIAAGDQVVEKNGARILLDSKSMIHLSGVEFDYKSERLSCPTEAASLFAR